jgi:hypothetical protein
LGGGGNPMFGSSETIAPFKTMGEMLGIQSPWPQSGGIFASVVASTTIPMAIVV